MEQVNNFEQSRERPKFLKVLCILTFIGSGFGLISNCVNYLNADTTSKLVHNIRVRDRDSLNHNTTSDRNDKIHQQKKDPVFLKKLIGEIKSSMTPGVIRLNSFWNFLGALFCMLGALLMWRMKISGYFLYFLGTAIGIITPLVIFGSGFLGVTKTLIPTFFGILFIIFYGMNLGIMKSPIKDVGSHV